MKLSIGHKLGLGFALITLLTMSSALIAFCKIYPIRGIEQTNTELRIPVISYSRDLFALHFELSSRSREYLLMADDPAVAPKLLAAMEETVKKMNLDVEKLQALKPKFLLQGNKDRVNAVAAHTVEFQRMITEATRMRKPRDSASELAAAKYMSAVSTPQARETRAILQELIESAQQLTDNDSARMQAAALSSTVTLASASLLVLICGVLIAFYVDRSISMPLSRAVAHLEEIAHGDLTATVSSNNLQRQDEIGALARGMESMSDNFRKLLGNISGGVDTLVTSAAQLSTVSAHTASGVASMSEKTTSVAAAAEEASASTMSVASGMEQSSASLTSVASATEEMSATVSDIAANTARARVTSENATSQAVAISAQMQLLGDAAREIGNVTQMITEISAQTNLLALNATIEAARAGAAGKGFAVVATEIKELARQTADATETIKSRIAGVQSSAGSAIANIDQISAVIREVGAIVSSIAAAIEQQAAVTRDVAGNIAQASEGVRDANSHIAQAAEVSKSIAYEIARVNGDVADLRRGGEQVQSSAHELNHLAELLKLQVAQFQM